MQPQLIKHQICVMWALLKTWYGEGLCIQTCGDRGGVGGGSGSGPDRKDWGVIQSPHKWIWLIEGASDPDWCTAGAPLIGEGGEWRREQREKRKREYGPQRKCIPDKNHAKH